VSVTNDKNVVFLEHWKGASGSYNNSAASPYNGIWNNSNEHKKPTTVMVTLTANFRSQDNFILESIRVC
jgi:hypothetical protein